MLARTLDKLVRDGLTSPTEIAELAGVSPSTAYRWIAGASQPDFNAVRLLIRHLKNPVAQEALLTVVAAGTGFRYQRSALDADVNHDGKIDADDALDGAIHVVYAAGESLTNVRNSLADNRVDRDEVVRLMAILNDVVFHSALVQEVLIRLADQNKPRRKCRPPNRTTTRSKT